MAFVILVGLALMLSLAAPAAAVCPPTDPPTVPNPPLRATLKFVNAPADVTFQSAAQIKLLLQVENCSGSNVLTTEGFSSTDFFRRLFFVGPDGQSIINTTEGGAIVNTGGGDTLRTSLHNFGRHYFCQYRNGVAQNPSIAVVPVETLTASPPFFREYTLDNPNLVTLYALTQPGHYTVNARIPLLTADTGNPAAIFTDCDFFDGNTVVNVANPTQAFTLVSNTLEFIIAASPAAAANSTITGTGPVAANGTATSTVTITLKDAGGFGVGGVTPTFLASGSENTLTACSQTDSLGVSQCTLASTKAETKTLSIATPIVKADGNVTFTPLVLDHLTLTPATTTTASGSYVVYTVEAVDGSNQSLGDVTNTTRLTVKGGKCAGRSCTATATGSHAVTATFSKKIGAGTLNVTPPTYVAKVWVGLKTKPDTGIKFDLQAILRKNGTTVASGMLASAIGGTVSFTGAKLNKIPLLAPGGSVDFSSGTVTLEVLVRNACAKSNRNAGTAELWYNGRKDDAGADRDAGSRLDLADGTTKFYLRDGPSPSLDPNPIAVPAKVSIDVTVGQKCGPFRSIGVWTRP